MRLKEIMSSPVEVIGPKSTAADARASVSRTRIHHLVIATGRDIVGIGGRSRPSPLIQEQVRRGKSEAVLGLQVQSSWTGPSLRLTALRIASVSAPRDRQ